MVCKLPSACSLSKARSEGDLRENMASVSESAILTLMFTNRQLRRCVDYCLLWLGGNCCYLKTFELTFTSHFKVTKLSSSISNSLRSWKEVSTEISANSATYFQKDQQM